MQNRRLILLMSILSFIVLIVVLSSTVFSFTDAEITFLSTVNVLNNNEEIIETANFDYGENIFFVDKDKYIESLEINNPYLRVISLETVFPNRLIIHAVERNEFYAFKLSNNEYVITDQFLKILEVKTEFVNSNSNGIRVFNYEIDIDPVDAVLGTTLKLATTYVNLLNNFAYNSQEWDSDIAILRGNIESVELSYEANPAIDSYDDILITMRQGLSIIVRDASENLSQKLQAAYSVYDSGAVDITTGQIEIIEEADGSFSAIHPEAD